jgi:exopolyphosphatase / guanosine-5'-triphosphate,3'-diphosphate pyrophosphatase
MRAAVIDVGSNSIKLLVAEKGGDGRLAEVASRTIEARISAGIGSKVPYLSPEGIARGIAAITELNGEAERAGAAKATAVATSAVRGASNGPEFAYELKCATGLKLRILSGQEEADLIGRGLTTDPALMSLKNFHAYDLGGGSLECLAFMDRKVRDSVSLPLGCVRLTEKFVASPGNPFGNDAEREISRQVKESLLESKFPLPVPPGFGVVGTGGTLTTMRAIVAENRGLSIEATNPMIGVTLLHEVLAKVARLDLDARRKLPGLAPERADVFPAALVTLLALAELGGFQAFHHSFRNLRWGVAAELLG